MKSAMPYYGLTLPTMRRTLRPVLDDPAYRITDRPLLGGDGPSAVGQCEPPRAAVCRDRPRRAPPLPLLAGPGHDPALPAPHRHRRLVGPRRRPRRRAGRRHPRNPPRHADPAPAGLGRRGRPVAAPQRDHLPARAQGVHRPRPADRRDRRQPRGHGIRLGVLHPQGHRLGAAPARPGRAGLGAGLRRRPRGPALAAVPPRGAQAPLRSAYPRARRVGRSPGRSARAFGPNGRCVRGGSFLGS